MSIELILGFLFAGLLLILSDIYMSLHIRIKPSTSAVFEILSDICIISAVILSYL